MEIISGPSSTVFGSNAMGGIVNLVTGSDYDHILSVGLEGGSFSTFIGKLFLAEKNWQTWIILFIQFNYFRWTYSPNQLQISRLSAWL